MLTLPIKKKWFDLILSGEKKEEYREIKDYYTIRFFNALGVMYFKDDEKQWTNYEKQWTNYKSSIFRTYLQFTNAYRDNFFFVMFRNGYSATSPSFIAQVSLDIGKGKEEWGAETGKKYYRLHIHDIKSVKL